VTGAPAARHPRPGGARPRRRSPPCTPAGTAARRWGGSGARP